MVRGRKGGARKGGTRRGGHDVKKQCCSRKNFFAFDGLWAVTKLRGMGAMTIL